MALYLLFAYPHRQAKGGINDLQGHFTNLEHAQNGIRNYPFHGSTMARLKELGVYGHVVQIEKGRAFVLSYFDPDEGWSEAQPEELAA